jgi:hypothetical protein
MHSEKRGEDRRGKGIPNLSRGSLRLSYPHDFHQKGLLVEGKRRGGRLVHRAILHLER